MPTIDIRGGGKAASTATPRLTPEQKAAQKFDAAYAAGEREYKGRNIRAGMAAERATEARQRSLLFTDYAKAQAEERQRQGASARLEREQAKKTEQAERARLAEQKKAEDRQLREQKKAEEKRFKDQQRSEDKSRKDAERDRLKSRQAEERDLAARRGIVTGFQARRGAAFDAAYGAAHAESYDRDYNAAHAENAARSPAESRQDRLLRMARQRAADREFLAGHGFGRPPGGGGGEGGGFFGGALGSGGIKGFVKSNPISSAVLATIAATTELALLPGQTAAGYMNLARPAIDLTKSTMAAGMAGGFRGRGLFNELGAGREATGWMSELMLTPEKVMDSMGAFGIAPRSQKQFTDYAKTFGRQSLLPGFSGMAPGTVERTANQAVGYGITNSPASTEKYLNKLGATLEGSLDRSKVLDSISSSIDSIAKTGAMGVSSQAVLDAVARFSSSGITTGRTGEAAARLISGESGRTARPLDDMQRQFVINSQLPKFNNLKEEQDVMGFIGPNAAKVAQEMKSKNPKLYEQAMQETLSAGTPFLRSAAAQAYFMTSDPTRGASLMSSTFSQMYKGRGFLQSQALANQTGMTPIEALGFRIGGDVTAPGGRSAGSNSQLLREGVPTDIGKYENNTAQLQLQGAREVLNTFVPAVTNATDAVGKFNKAIENVVVKLNQMAKGGDSMYSGSGTAHDWQNSPATPSWMQNSSIYSRPLAPMSAR